MTYAKLSEFSACGVTLLVLSFPLQFPRGMGHMDELTVLKALDKVYIYNQRGTVQTLHSFSHYSSGFG